jgi:hypothetical protein
MEEHTRDYIKLTQTKEGIGMYAFAMTQFWKDIHCKHIYCNSFLGTRYFHTE